MTWEFKVGQKVVCVDDKARGGGWDRSGWFIKAGEIYLISALNFRLSDDPHVHNNTPGLDLHFSEGDQGPCKCCGARIGFAARRFRPLVTDTQSWLKEVLETPPVPTEDEIAEAQIAYAWSRL